MMRHFFLCIALGLGVASCATDDNPSSENLVGTWSWLGATGGISGDEETPESTGENR